MKRLALAAIRGYQRWLSPLKGFSCTLRVWSGAESCSAYGYRVIERFGLRCGLGLLDRRLALCGHVHRRTRAARVPLPPHPLRRRQQGFCDAPCDVPACDLPSCHLPSCHGSSAACDTAGNLLDVCSCGCDAGYCGRSRRHEATPARSAQMDAIAERTREQQARRRREARRDAGGG
ncbi:membrane protein insertion efficiency factor YidD [Massilia phyllosphaerae]|uniref:membrane protein insertion efficiency factor YidD n=1 Tax=Massilia phyllosphaerae TaxID=3106034 RepID=UPI002B1CBA94|nr:membrane protein insertion efficiency factor YidD [Massilia sp. SGZ-792]